MDKISFFTKTRRCIFLTWLAVVLICQAQVFAHRVVIIMDDDLSIYRKVLASFRFELKQNIAHELFQINGDQPETIVEQVSKMPPDLYVAIGPKAANALKKKIRTTPIVFCMVPRPEDYDLMQENVVGVHLEQSLEDQIRLFKEIFPERKRIGVIYNPRTSQALIDQVKELLDLHGRKLVAIKVPKPEKAALVLKDHVNAFDLLWMLSDPSALHLEAFEAAQRFTLNHHIPYVVLSDAFVAKGGLLAIQSDYAALGRQMGQLANQIVLDSLDIKKLTMLRQEIVNMSLNMSTIKKIGLSDRFAGDLLQTASKYQYGVVPVGTNQ